MILLYSTKSEVTDNDKTILTKIKKSENKNKNKVIKLMYYTFFLYFTQDGYTALMYSSWKGGVGAVKLLLEAKADVNILNNVSG